MSLLQRFPEIRDFFSSFYEAVSQHINSAAVRNREPRGTLTHTRAHARNIHTRTYLSLYDLRNEHTDTRGHTETHTHTHTHTHTGACGGFDGERLFAISEPNPPHPSIAFGG